MSAHIIASCYASQFQFAFDFIFNLTLKHQKHFSIFTRKHLPANPKKQKQSTSKGCAREIYSRSELSRMLLILLMSLVLQFSNGSGGDWTPPSAVTLSIICREISVDASGADFPRRGCFVSSSLDSSGDILETKAIKMINIGSEASNQTVQCRHKCKQCCLVRSLGWRFTLENKKLKLVKALSIGALWKNF